MDIYLPIAEVSLDVFVLLGIGAAIALPVLREVKDITGLLRP